MGAVIATGGFRVAPRAGWLEVPADVDPQVWASRTAEEVRARAGLDEDWLATEVLAAQLTLVAQQVVRSAPALALVHLPDAQRPPVLVVEVVLADLPDGASTEDVVQDLRVPDEQVVDGPRTATVPSAAGPALKLRQRWWTGEDRRVLDSTAYVWAVADQRAALVAMTTTGDLVAAEQAQPALDALAGGVELLGPV